MHLYRFDNLYSFPVLDSFSNGCLDIQTSLNPWSQIGDAVEVPTHTSICASANPTKTQHRSIWNHSLSLMKIAAQSLTTTQPMEVVLALPTVGIAGPMESVDILVDSCSGCCRISIDASEVDGSPFTIDLGSTTAKAIESLSCHVDSEIVSNANHSHIDRFMPPTLIQLHRLHLIWPAGIDSAQIKLASLHVYGNVRRASSLIAEK